MMCNPEDHPVDFEVYQTPDESGEFFGFQYTGNISINILVSYDLHVFLKGSPLIPSMMMSLHNNSNVMLKFVLNLLTIRHAQQAVLNQRQQLQRPQQQPPLPKKEILLSVKKFSLMAASRLHVQKTIAIFMIWIILM